MGPPLPRRSPGGGELRPADRPGAAVDPHRRRSRRTAAGGRRRCVVRPPRRRGRGPVDAETGIVTIGTTGCAPAPATGTGSSPRRDVTGRPDRATGRRSRSVAARGRVLCPLRRVRLPRLPRRGPGGRGRRAAPGRLHLRGHQERLRGPPARAGPRVRHAGRLPRRHAQAQQDPDLLALHAAHPMVALWDDHDLADNAWRGGAHTPTSTALVRAVGGGASAPTASSCRSGSRPRRSHQRLASTRCR